MIRLQLAIAVCFLSGVAGFALPQAAAQANRGFVRTAPAYASGEERNRQTSLRVMEVQFKPMRMIWVDVTNPKTGERERKEVWYLVYRAIARPAEGREDATDSTPVNLTDPVPAPQQFVPELVITTYDDPEDRVPLQIVQDQYLPEAVRAIRMIEQRPASQFARRKIEDALSIIRPWPDPVPADAPPEEQDWIYGVATWTGIDPATDFFTVTMRGFSNAYDSSKTGPDGNPQPWRKVIVQDFIRRGDEFDPTQREFEFGEGPDWTYQPDSTQWSTWQPPTADN